MLITTAPRDYSYIFDSKSGHSYRSIDGLHGQVLSYRLGFGDLLPQINMRLHVASTLSDLNTTWGTKFDSYSDQNWLMGDFTVSALKLRWNEADAWNTAQRQVCTLLSFFIIDFVIGHFLY